MFPLGERLVLVSFIFNTRTLPLSLIYKHGRIYGNFIVEYLWLCLFFVDYWQRKFCNLLWLYFNPPIKSQQTQNTIFCLSCHVNRNGYQYLVVLSIVLHDKTPFYFNDFTNIFWQIDDLLSVFCLMRNTIYKTKNKSKIDTMNI